MLSRANFCGEPHEVSLLWALWDMKTAGGMAQMNDIGSNGGTLVIKTFTHILGDDVVTDELPSVLQSAMFNKESETHPLTELQ
jgi:hypothetical protein